MSALPTGRCASGWGSGKMNSCIWRVNLCVCVCLRCISSVCFEANIRKLGDMDQTSHRADTATPRFSGKSHGKESFSRTHMVKELLEGLILPTHRESEGKRAAGAEGRPC